ncbi:MAG: mycofactocin-associated electron transfer flavoprotein alpha subunit [Acidimicrobiia bacterium]|nr:mycofactocin-associated electron transfer flavoprotein alpha subunit [Acidimicrobiia bacterium]
MLAVIPIRDGELPAGADETLADCGGVGWLVGTGTTDVDVAGLAIEITDIDLGDFEVGRWSAALAPLLRAEPLTDVIVLPHSPDGRDLAPRLAVALDRPLLAGCSDVIPDRVKLIRRDGREEHTMHPQGPFVATLLPGVRGVGFEHDDVPAQRRTIVVADVDSPSDASVVEVLPPDLSTIDLTEAHRIVGGGAGLDEESRFPQLARVAAAIGGSMGATRVITDRAWVPHDKQIGTTGVIVDPDLYVSFGISGAVQHTAGLGNPDHIISVNTDPHCPMMQMSDLAIVADANETLDELHAALAADGSVASDESANG